MDRRLSDHVPVWVEQLDPVTSSPEVARGLVRRVAAGSGLPESKVDLATLLVSEVVTNAVKHGPRQVPMEIRITISDGIGVTVWNRGPWFDPRAAREWEEAGLGLGLVDELAAEWGVRYVNDGIEIWFDV
jgi:anti-sigma regulatory factor (Ser/Thr protein kinase)